MVSLGQQWFNMKVELPAGRPTLTVALSDGSEATLSPLARSDREWIEEGFDELSVESRYTRFGIGVAGLSSNELNYLADVDQQAHVAWGALVDGNGAGVGRYITPSEPVSPEVAVTVLDEFQGIGLGTILLRTLVAVARHDGVDALIFWVVPGNARVQAKLSSIGSTTASVDGLIEGRIVVSDIARDAIEKQVVEVLEEFRQS